MFYEGDIITNAVIVLTWITIVAAAFKNPQCAIAVALSLISANLVVHFDVKALHIIVLFVCALITITNLDGSESNDVNYAVSLLYAVRIAVWVPFLIEGYGAETFWILSTLLLILQLIIILGSCINGISKRIDDFLGDIGRHYPSLFVLQKRTYFKKSNKNNIKSYNEENAEIV